MINRFNFFLASLLLCLSSAAAFGQNATTSLRGAVKDPTGAEVPGAVITLVNAANAQILTTKSGSSGDYQLQQIPPATYTITVTAPGFGKQVKSAELLVNQPATINFALAVNASTEVVNVNVATETLNTTDASLGTARDNSTIQALPSEERNVADLLSLQPGVFFIPVTATSATSQDSRSGSVNGSRSDQGNVTVDGVDDNDEVNGYAFFGVLRETEDSTEEFRVATGGSNSDAGHSSGAQISLVTKSGTNKFHGAAYEYNRPTNTVANDYFNKQAQLASGQANRPPKLIRNLFGFDLGGPILKDKLFFFGNYEGRRQAESTVVTRTTPTASYKQGILSYVGDTAAGAADPTPQTITPAQFATLDAANGCAVCGTTAYPSGPGANPNALAYLNSLPTANGVNLGDGGYNTGSYTFASPSPYSTNTTIARLDYIPSNKHRIFVRGNLQKDVQTGTQQFPGQPPSDVLISNNKGLAVGDTWTISANIVNDIRYGYTRQGSGDAGVGSGDYVDFRFLDTPTAETRSTILSSPVNNIVDNMSITHGKHTFQVGANWRLIHQNRISNANSYNNATTNPFWISGGPPDPSTTNANAEMVDSGFSQSYLEAYANLVGIVPEVTNVANYQVTGATTGTLLADGASLARHFSSNEYEGYAQDAWRVMPNLTLTVGLRYTVLQTPYETKGQEVTPTIDTDTWYKQREASALQGVVYEPNLTFAPAGKFYNKPGFYPKNKNDFAPRVAIAYAPNGKTSIRGGFGIYYDHFGEGLVNIFDQHGAFGLSGTNTNPAGVQNLATSPRFTARNAIPNIGGSASAASVTYPYIPNTTDNTDFAITWGIDSKIKTPYSESFDFSVQRDLPKGFSLEATYVGRLGRHLLQSLDLTEPVDFTDPQGSGDYYAAGTQLSKAVDANAGNNLATVQTIPYFEHIFPFMANNPNVQVFDNNGNQIYSGAGHTATQNIYTAEWAPYRSTLGATTSLADIDFYCAYGCPGGYQSKFWQQQFASLYALASIGMSYYNGGSITLRHPNSHGLQFDISYTYSRSIDFGSDAERSSEFATGTAAFANSEISNTWRPYLNKAVSDFNTTHLLTGNWVIQLPFGKGKPFLGNAGPVLDALIGGWQSSGIARLTSGLPWSVFEPGYTTDWQIPSYGVVSQPSMVHSKRSIAKDGTVTYFNNSSTINSGITTGGPIRLPYPGEAGQRNNFLGDGYFDVDSGLSKSWKVSHYGNLKFAWEVYNVSNSVRFDPFSIGAGLGGGNLGIASSSFGGQGYRRMQFALRYDF